MCLHVAEELAERFLLQTGGRQVSSTVSFLLEKCLLVVFVQMILYGGYVCVCMCVCIHVPHACLYES